MTATPEPFPGTHKAAEGRPLPVEALTAFAHELHDQFGIDPDRVPLDMAVDLTHGVLARHLPYLATDLEAENAALRAEMERLRRALVDAFGGELQPGLISFDNAIGTARHLYLMRRAVHLDDSAVPRDWRAVDILPGTPYPDEPSETVPPGWYVMGGQPDDDEATPYVLRVEQSPDSDGAAAARAVAARLNGGTA